MEAQIVVYLKRVKFSFEVLEKIMTNQIFFALCYICNFDFVFLQSESACCQGPRLQLLFFYETLLKNLFGFQLYNCISL